MSSIVPSVSGVEGSGQVAKKGSAWVSARTSERSKDLSGCHRITEELLFQAIALQIYASDPKYKKYVQQVEKCLNSFDNVHEWADCIAFLKQLLKVRNLAAIVTKRLRYTAQTFQSYMQFKEIPRKLIVAKRLAQCLNPALPTGVHQRALEVYVHILSVLGVCLFFFDLHRIRYQCMPIGGKSKARLITLVFWSIPLLRICSYIC